jgi:hypothetical protein
MKWPSYILSVYMLLLAVLPCCAFDDCPEDKIQKEQAANHENGDEDCGTCSPFFNCEGCASATATIDHVYYNIISLPVKQVYTGFLSPYIRDIHYDFWQPPKLVLC